MVETRSQRAAAAASSSDEGATGLSADKEDEQDAGPAGAGPVRSDSDDTPKGGEENAHAESEASDIQSTTERAEDDGAAAKLAAESRTSERRSYAIIALLALITYAAYPGATWGNDNDDDALEPTVHTVFYYGWISAISTGLGVLPLCFAADIDAYWIGVSNAIAGGMMTAASYSLFAEGAAFHDAHDDSCLAAPLRTGLGALLGLLFILGTKSFLDRHEDVKLGALGGADARKILLIVFVMTLHSFSEGVGIGVSFGGEHGRGLGVFISASLAVHNIPEGLAVAIVLLPRKVSKATAAIWCVVTSLPQPLMAVPAFMFVHSFLPLLPVGLGFAGGAMVWVAFMELLLEAYEDTDAVTAGVTSTAAAAFMIAMQRQIEEHA